MSFKTNKTKNTDGSYGQGVDKLPLLNLNKKNNQRSKDDNSIDI